MRFLDGNVIYDYIVAQDESVALSIPPATDPIVDEFQVNLTYRRFHESSQLPEIELLRYLRLPHTESESNMMPLMVDVLQELEVPERARGDMALHFKFILHRLLRMNRRRMGIITVTVSVDVKVIPLERVAEIRSRLTLGIRRANANPRALPVTEVMTMPAKKSAVEALVREKAMSDYEETDCVICLEKFVLEAEVIKMPCLHVYHKDCIIQWLERTHSCPFCRFKLPC